MNDDKQELIRLAALAVKKNIHGWEWFDSPYPIRGVCNSGFWTYKSLHSDEVVYWCPLDNDADALQIATALNMSVEIIEYESSTYAYAGEVPRVYDCQMWSEIGKEAATRLAIVQAAAKLAIKQGLK